MSLLGYAASAADIANFVIERGKYIPKTAQNLTGNSMLNSTLDKIVPAQISKTLT